MCLGSTSTDVVIEFILLPLNLKSSITMVISLGHIWVKIRICSIPFGYYDATLSCVGGISEVSCLALLVK